VSAVVPLRGKAATPMLTLERSNHHHKFIIGEFACADDFRKILKVLLIDRVHGLHPPTWWTMAIP
jgi:hypothetical protein